MILGTLIDLRPVRAADLAQLRQWEGEPQIAHGLTTTATLLDARESAEQEYDRLVRTPRVKILAVQTKAGSLVGFIRLNDLDFGNRKAEVRIFLALDQQGQGYGTDALHTLIAFCFRELALHRLGLVVRADNARALRLYARLGFVTEGGERDAVWSAGTWVTLIHMGMLAGEWRKEHD